MRSRGQRLLVVLVMVIGLGLVAAPAVFQMFERAPLGGEMIDDFTPYMTDAQVAEFRGYLAEIDAANDEAASVLRADLIAAGATTDGEYASTFSAANGLHTKWEGIDADMSDLLDRMDRNLGNFAAVAALPPFPMFPWFFVIPGLIIAGIAASVLVSFRHRRPAPRRTWTLVGLGVALVLAPAVFQMFTRAPQGRDMIDDFRPMMTRERVQAVQGYFVTLGAAEGQLRVKMVPLAEQAGADAADYPAIRQFSTDWPAILLDFNPMVATMNDSLDNYAAVDALPSFDLFPWFFVIPGVLVAGLAALAARRRPDGPDGIDPGIPSTSPHSTLDKETPMPSTSSRVIAALAALVLVSSACGDDSSGDSATTAASTAPATTAAATTAPVTTVPVTAAPVTTAGPATTPAPTTLPATTLPATTLAPTTTAAAAFEGELVGTFSIDPAVCVDATVTGGSYFKMIQVGGTLEAGPFIQNADSPCSNLDFSTLSPGTDGGLVTGVSQAAPEPAYDAGGNGLASAIFEPVTFFAVAFAGATDPAGAVPTITATDGVLSGDLSAFTAYYGGASFNQGAPKPDGSGSAPTGTIDPTTGEYVLEWTSLISGGAFNGFTGVWHLEGTFTAA